MWMNTVLAVAGPSVSFCGASTNKLVKRLYVNDGEWLLSASLDKDGFTFAIKHWCVQQEEKRRRNEYYQQYHPIDGKCLHIFGQS